MFHRALLAFRWGRTVRAALIADFGFILLWNCIYGQTHKKPSGHTPSISLLNTNQEFRLYKTNITRTRDSYHFFFFVSGYRFFFFFFNLGTFLNVNEHLTHAFMILETIFPPDYLQNLLCLWWLLACSFLSWFL